MSHTPVWLHTTNRFSIRSYGALIQNPYEDTNTDLSLAALGGIASELGAEQVLWQRLANNRFPGGRWKVDRFEEKVAEYFVTKCDDVCDGILVTKPADAVVLLTKDCPVVVLGHHNAPGVLVLHCGREALHGIDRGRLYESVIKRGFEQWNIEDTHGVYGAITMGIHHSNFPNKHIPHIVAELKDFWGQEVVPDTDTCTIDLTELILRQLEHHGVLRTAIVHDTLDTFSDERLGSVRANRGNAHNAVFVVVR